MRNAIGQIVTRSKGQISVMYTGPQGAMNTCIDYLLVLGLPGPIE